MDRYRRAIQKENLTWTHCVDRYNRKIGQSDLLPTFAYMLWGIPHVRRSKNGVMQILYLWRTAAGSDLFASLAKATDLASLRLCSAGLTLPHLSWRIGGWMCPCLSGLTRVLSYGDPFLLPPDPEDPEPRLLRADPASQYGNPFLLSPDPFLPSPEPEDRRVNAPRLIRTDPGAQQGHHHLQFFQIPHNFRSKIT